MARPSRSKTAPEQWDVWSVDDAKRRALVVNEGITANDARKDADRRNETAKRLDPGVRFVALPQGQEPEYESVVPAPEPAPPVVVLNPIAPSVTHRWVCVLEGTAPSAVCSHARPHGKGYSCGFWFTFSLPVNGITTSLADMTSSLIRVGVTGSFPSQVPPAY